MNEIIVIGTNPPCPRCQLLTNVVSAKIKELNIVADFKHLPYTSDMAKMIAENNGLTVGTAKDVAKKLNVTIDFEAFAKLISNFKPDENCSFYKYNNCSWSIEMDNLLKHFENTASDVGILMTPVLIINGEIMHQGSVPQIDKIIKWLSNLK